MSVQSEDVDGEVDYGDCDHQGLGRVLNVIPDDVDDVEQDEEQRKNANASRGHLTSGNDVTRLTGVTKMETDSKEIVADGAEEMDRVDHVATVTSYDRMANHIGSRSVNGRAHCVEPSCDSATPSPPSCTNSPTGTGADSLPYAMEVNENHPFLCVYCDKAFAKRSHVDKHQQLSHGDQLRYNCTDCDRVFRHKRSRDRHVTIHSGERRYRCVLCDAQFTRSDHLKIHMKIHANSPTTSPGGGTVSNASWNPVRQFMCPDCDVSVSTIGALTAHLLTHHHDRDTDTNSSGSTDDVTGITGNDSGDETACSMCVGHVTSSHADQDMDVDVTTTNDQPVNRETGISTAKVDRDWKTNDVVVDDEDDVSDAVTLECPYCQRKDFSSVGPLSAHIRTTHSRPSDNLFACDVCGLAFSTVSKLEHHRADEHPTELADVAKPAPVNTTPPAATVIEERTPKLASSSSSSAKQLADDIVARFSCGFCPVQFYDESTRTNHERTIHLAGRSHQADNNSTFSSVFQLSASGGLADSLSPVTASTAVFCSQCSLGFPHIYALADHMHHSHGYNNRVSGSVGRPIEVTSPAAKSPMSSSIENASAKNVVTCRRDPVKPTAVRADSVELRQSSRTSGGGSGICLEVKHTSMSSLSKCVECSATFENDDDLDCHVTSAHYLSLATEFGCTSCLKLFARPDDLQKHLMDVHAHHLYRCTLCKQVFDSKVNIQVHFAVRHSNECQVYRCTKCSMVFHSEMEWQLHVRVHHLGVARPYRCFFCRDGFSSELELSVHVAAHKKPFSCPLCGESFLVEFLLDRHLEMKHPCLDSAAMPLGAKLPHGSGLLGTTQPTSAGEVNLSIMSTIPPASSPQTLDLRQSLSSSVTSQMLSGKRDDDPVYIDSKNNHRSATNKGGNSTSGQALDKMTSGPDSKLTHVCVYCSVGFRSKSELEKHVKTTHVMPSTSQKCNICDELFPSAAVLAEHKLTHCKVVYGNVCVVCKATMHTEEEFIIHSQQHSTTNQSNSSRQVSPQTVTGSGSSNAASNVTTMPCIVCRQTLVSLLELRLHARHHFQSQQHVLSLPPPPPPPARPPSHTPHGLAVTSSGPGFRSRYVCCLCLGQFDSAESVMPRAGGYYVCVTCNNRDNGLIVFDATQGALRSGGTAEKMSLPLPPPRTYQCIKCQESFNSELEVRVHVTCHVINEGNVHECRLCYGGSPIVFDSPARLQSHVIVEHEFGADSSSSESTGSAAVVVRPCAVCGVTLVGPAAARAHSLEHGPSSWPHVCSQCPLRFFFAAELRNHELVAGHHHSGGTRPSSVALTNSPDPTDDLRCPECSRVFSGYASLCSHRRVHEKPIAMATSSGGELLQQECATRCSSHDNQLTSESGRERMAVNGVKGHSTPLQCPECSRQFPSLSSLQGHMRVHSSGTKYSCNECGKAFSLPQNLAIHMNSHRDDQRPHECTTCHKRFSKKENLKSHMRSHSASSGELANSSGTSHIPEYFSVQCLLGAVSPTPKSTRQNRCFGGAKPVEHLCPICGGRFLQTADLGLHLTKIHGIKAEVVEAEMASSAAAALPNSPEENSVDEGFCAAIENATSSNSSNGGIHRMRSNGELDLHASPALSVK